jgi:hypothetical protein
MVETKKTTHETMSKELKVKKNTAQKDKKRTPGWIVQFLIILVVLGFLWLVGKSILYFYSFIVSRL